MKNKIRNAFLISIAALVAYFALASLKIISSYYNYSVVIASVIAMFNFIIFVLAYYYAAQKPAKLFILLILGSLVIRLFLMVIAVFISIKFLKVDVLAFIFAFFIWYVFLLIYEIFIVQDGINHQNH